MRPGIRRHGTGSEGEGEASMRPGHMRPGIRPEGNREIPNARSFNEAGAHAPRNTFSQASFTSSTLKLQ